MKNIRKRVDGRWEWRKQINYVNHCLIAPTQTKLLPKIRAYKQQLKKQQVQKIKISKKFIDIAWQWFYLYKAKKIKSTSTYTGIFKNYLNIKKDMDLITVEYWQKLLDQLESVKPRVAKNCYSIITNVYDYAFKKELIKKNHVLLLVKPIYQANVGQAFTLTEQKLILDNLNKTPIGNEILFYMLSGCRREEAIKCFENANNINYDKLLVFIPGTKTLTSRRYVKISKTYACSLKLNYINMYKHQADYYSKAFQEYLELLNIKNHTLHDLRHTYATNLYYLGAPLEERKYMLGHSSIQTTNDIYTHMDLTISKSDVLKLYNNLYPEF